MSDGTIRDFHSGHGFVVTAINQLHAETLRFDGEHSVNYKTELLVMLCFVKSFRVLLINLKNYTNAIHSRVRSCLGVTSCRVCYMLQRISTADGAFTILEERTTDHLSAFDCYRVESVRFMREYRQTLAYTSSLLDVIDWTYKYYKHKVNDILMPTFC